MLVFTQDFFAPTLCCLLLLLVASAFSHHSPPSSDPCDFTVNDIRQFASSSSFKPFPFDPSSVTALHSAWSSSRDHIPRQARFVGIAFQNRSPYPVPLFRTARQRSRPRGSSAPNREVVEAQRSAAPTSTSST